VKSITVTAFCDVTAMESDRWETHLQNCMTLCPRRLYIILKQLRLCCYFYYFPVLLLKVIFIKFETQFFLNSVHVFSFYCDLLLGFISLFLIQQSYSQPGYTNKTTESKVVMHFLYVRCFCGIALCVILQECWTLFCMAMLVTVLNI
jgi:hypothetical protein